MKYRYFCTERPIRTGTYPRKSGCVTSYPQKRYIDGRGFFAWGHIDYDEPLTDAEVKEYKLKPDKWEFSVGFIIFDNEQMGRIHNLFVKWCKCVTEDAMLNSIVEAISIKLNDEFRDKYPIYTEYVEQGCKGPCFFILPISQEIKEELGDSAKKSITFNIMFDPEDESKTNIGILENREILKISTVLLEKMKLLDVEGKILRGTNISSETTGEILNFIVTYSYRFRRDRKAKYMEKLKQKGGTKNV